MKKISDYIMIKEASKLLGVTDNTLRTWSRTNKIRTYIHPINKYRLYNKEDLEAFLGKIKPNNAQGL